jgi:hypothetical protein
MSRNTSNRFVLAGALVVGGNWLHAQETPRFAFDFGGGFTQTVGNTQRHLDNGWNMTAGAGMNFTNYFATMIDLGYKLQFQVPFYQQSATLIFSRRLPGRDSARKPMQRRQWYCRLGPAISSQSSMRSTYGHGWPPDRPFRPIPPLRARNPLAQQDT